ncbi:HAD family hydrolase [Patescibacteria group bacterium]
MENKLVLFDIDGTLFKSRNPIGLKSIVVAIKNVFGVDVEFNIAEHDGSTDRKIIVDLLKEKGISEDKVILKLAKLSEERTKYFVTHAGNTYKNSVFKEAVEFAQKLKSKNIYIGLLTGNFSQVGWKKLKMANIDSLFDFGLFGEMAENRNELAKLIFKKAKHKLNINFSKDNIFIIGDTPRDMECGKKAGVKTIGVATGIFNKNILKKAGADLAVSNLGDKEVLNCILKNEC